MWSSISLVHKLPLLKGLASKPPTHNLTSPAISASNISIFFPPQGLTITLSIKCQHGQNARMYASVFFFSFFSVIHITYAVSTREWREFVWFRVIRCSYCACLFPMNFSEIIFCREIGQPYI